MNETVTKKREENGFYFVWNGNTFRKYLCKNGVHITDEGTNIFAGNTVEYIRHLLLKEFWKGVACNERHFEEYDIDIDKGSSENSSENKDSNLKSKQDLNPL